MGRQEIIKKITEKKEFSGFPEEDVEIAFEKFERRQTSDEDKIKLTRDLLRKVYSVFTSRKLLNLKIIDRKTSEEILKKHISTRERFDYYFELYGRIFERIEDGKISVIDLGAGINGLSFKYFPKEKEISYIAVEAVGQLVDLMNYYFEKKKISDRAKAIHESLFNLEKIKNLLKRQKGKKIIFLLKVVDSLEMIKSNYSKKFLNEVTPLADLVVVSFATKSLGSKKSFKVKRYWFENFVSNSFKVLDRFELGNEIYFVFRKE